VVDVIVTWLVALALTKFTALCWTIPNLLVKGPRVVEDLRRRNVLDTANFSAEFNPIDRALDRWAAAPRWRQAALPAFTLPVVTTACAVGALSLPASDVLTVTLGVLTAGCVLAILLIAVLRRMVLGDDEWRTSDLNPRRFGIPSEWALANDRRAKRSVYLLALIYLQIIGFGALYAVIHRVDPSAFSLGGNEETPLTWVYLSVATVATVGFGDVHARSTAAEAAVVAQIGTGPLILTWLLANLAGGSNTGEYELVLTPPVCRALTERLPEAVAAEVINFLTTALVREPRRVGKPLRGDLTGIWAGRRGDYRVLYRVREDTQEVVVVRIEYGRSTGHPL
jgi:mRNA-degrading endonuclease RelE of RelBE toxin-antitoxin system